MRDCSQPVVTKGGQFSDHRGRLCFVNEFHFKDVKRFYAIHPSDDGTVRAWQGHRLESKHFYAIKGRFCLCWVKIDDWARPSSELPCNNIILSENESKILTVPPGYANGFKALQAESALLVLSDRTLEESSEDTYRFNEFYWCDWSNIR